MADHSPEEIKKENIEAMGEPLGLQFSELRQEVVRIHIKWAEFVDLFGSKKESVELLNQAAPLFFLVTHDALWEALVLHIARLTDPSNSLGQQSKSNLTIQNLPALISDDGLKSRVANLIEVAKKDCAFCREWRDRLFAHRDLKLALKVTPSPTTTLQQVGAALKSLADVLNAVDHHFKKTQTVFELTNRHNGAATLLKVLGDGIRARDEECERLKREIESTEQSNKAGKKSNKLKARLPRGLADRGPADIAATRRMTDAIRDVYERYGFEPVETPAIEYTDALGKFLPDQDRPNEGVFSFQDDDEQWLSLRYDLTAPLARYVAENFDALPKPYRSYRYGWVFRNEKPGPGRFRQFMQFDADTVGSGSMAADAEMCMMAADTMEALGLKGQYVVKVNNRKVLDGVLEAIGLGGEASAGRRLTVLRAIDKLDRLGAEGVRHLLGEGRKDESGDFTKGAGLDAGAIDRVLAFVGSKGVNAATTLENLTKVVAGSTQGEAGVDELRQISALTTSSAYADDRVLIDPSVVRGLEYYTGPVYEVELLIETKDEKGRPVRFGSVGGGGRYDGLVSRFRGEPVPATGFSIGVSRLQAALTMIGKLDGKAAPGPVVVTVFDRDRTADYQRMVGALRNAGIRAELYLGNPKNFGNQFKYADKRGSPCVVIQGGDEKAKGEVQIKDLILGAEIAGLSKDRDDYLKKQAEAQFTVPETDLISAVRKVLNRRGGLDQTGGSAESKPSRSSFSRPEHWLTNIVHWLSNMMRKLGLGH